MVRGSRCRVLQALNAAAFFDLNFFDIISSRTIQAVR
jgi:hypothetical protein